MNPYIQSLRLRTLPLSVSGIILGTGLAGWSHWLTFALAMCTTLCLQILSNLCNELGDAQKGTDMIWLFISLCVLFGIGLIYSAFGSLWSYQSLGFMGLGLLAIVGAITYTLGKHSYGYIGLGDLGVFVFFGLVSTLGAYYLQTQTMTREVVWLGVAIGLPCVGVLNLNNIRDMAHDIAHGKRTFASILGPIGGRVYQTLLLAGCLGIFIMYGRYWVLCVLPVWVWHLCYVWTHREKLDKQMPILMITTLFVAVLALI